MTSKEKRSEYADEVKGMKMVSVRHEGAERTKQDKLCEYGR
jgi:hypothetical protein